MWQTVSVCLLANNSRCYEWILMKFEGNDNAPGNSSLFEGALIIKQPIGLYDYMYFCLYYTVLYFWVRADGGLLSSQRLDSLSESNSMNFETSKGTLSGTGSSPPTPTWAHDPVECGWTWIDEQLLSNKNIILIKQLANIVGLTITKRLDNQHYG